MAKVAGPKLSKDRQAAVLALADNIGPARAAAKFGIRSTQTIRNYRAALATDGELRQLYDQAKARQDAVDDRVVEAEASAIIAVWGAVKSTAEKLRESPKPASPQHLQALAALIAAAGKNADQRAELGMSQKMFEAVNGRRPGEVPAIAAAGGGVRATPAHSAAADAAVH